MIISDEELKRDYQLKNLIRYNTRERVKDETVAEHSFYVTLYTLKICDKLSVSDTVKQQCLIKALLHDLPETELNDITHDVKEKLNLGTMLKKYEDDFYIRYYGNYTELMNNEHELVDIIVKLADVYSVKQYCINEISLGNNTCAMKEIYNNAIQRINKLEGMLKI